MSARALFLASLLLVLAFACAADEPGGRSDGSASVRMPRPRICVLLPSGGVVEIQAQEWSTNAGVLVVGNDIFNPRATFAPGTWSRVWAGTAGNCAKGVVR